MRDVTINRNVDAHKHYDVLGEVGRWVVISSDSIAMLPVVRPPYVINIIPLVQRKIRYGVQVQGQGEWTAAGGQVCADPQARGQAECGAGGGDNEFIAASPHHTVVRGIRISENDVRRPRTVRKFSRGPFTGPYKWMCSVCLSLSRGRDSFSVFLYKYSINVYAYRLDWALFGDQELESFG